MEGSAYHLPVPHLFIGKGMIDKLGSIYKWLIKPADSLPEPERRRADLLAKILLFLLLFAVTTLILVILFDPHDDPYINQYALLIGGLIGFFSLSFGLNRTGYYQVAAFLLVGCAASASWISLIFDPSIFQGDFVPLTYLAFSVLLSSILLSTLITIVLAVIQITGLTLVLVTCGCASSFNWFSFLAFVILTSIFSILANNVIQRNIKRIEDQSRQLAFKEEQLREQSIQDYLTRLFNRRYLEESLKRKIQRAELAQSSIGVIMLDIDNFKPINDTRGHAVGDIVLQEIGKFLSGQVRQSDIACRYGGDEFVVILPETSKEIAKERADQLRNEVKSLVIQYNDQILGTITLSLGVAVFPDDGSDGEELLKSADAALYEAKGDGGDRVVLAGRDM
jgi:diguanylate cyclase (GGDEF)-like protein